VFDIAFAKLKASGTLVYLSNQQTMSWTADKDKIERVTSLQSPAQIIKGENKDLSEYRKKNFDRGEFVSLSGGCGQNAADAITKAIKKQLK